MDPANNAPADHPERHYKPASITLIIIKAVVIAAVLVALANYGTRIVLALMP